jgi:hypothetical protein
LTRREDRSSFEKPLRGGPALRTATPLNIDPIREGRTRIALDAMLRDVD